MENYKIEKDFEHNGLRCVVVLQPMGHRCGYVGISEKHPLYGVDYGTETNILSPNSMTDIPMGKAGLGQMLNALSGGYNKESISPEMFFRVHGGITYSGGGKQSKYPVESDLWWFGFDCAHAGDAKDLTVMDERQRKIWDSLNYGVVNYGVVRSESYCIKECESLAEQLATCGKRG